MQRANQWLWRVKVEVGQQGSGCDYKRATWGIPVVMEMFCILAVSILLSWLYCTVVLQDVTTEANWIKGTQDLSVLFLTITFLSQNKLIYIELIFPWKLHMLWKESVKTITKKCCQISNIWYNRKKKTISIYNSVLICFVFPKLCLTYIFITLLLYMMTGCLYLLITSSCFKFEPFCLVVLCFAYASSLCACFLICF